MSKIHDNYGEIIEYAGYKARISYDTQDHVFVGEVLDIDDCISFHSKTEDGIITAFKNCISSYRDIRHKTRILEK